MAYKKTDLEKQALKAIKKKELIFIEDVVCFLPCSRATFYNHDLDKLDSLKDALQENKTNMKVSLRSKWFKSDNATLQIALMRLICNSEERRKLSINHQEVTGKGGAPLIMSRQERDKRIAELEIRMKS